MTTSRRINITTSSNRSLNQTPIKSVAKPVESVLAPTYLQQQDNVIVKLLAKQYQSLKGDLSDSLHEAIQVKYSVVQTAKICRRYAYSDEFW